MHAFASKRKLLLAHKNTHIYSHKHACTHLDTLPGISAYIHAYMHTSHTHSFKLNSAEIPTHIYIYTHEYTYTINTCTHKLYTHTYAHALRATLWDVITGS